MSRSSKKLIRMFAVLLVCVFVVMSFGATAFAASINPNVKGSLRLQAQHNGNNVAGGSFKIYKVAEIIEYTENDLTYALVAPFDASDYDINDVKNSSSTAIVTAANALLPYVGEAVAINVNNGAWTKDLELGVYLVVNTAVPSGYTAANPFLVFMPMLENDVWYYTITAFPKLGATSPTPSNPIESTPPVTTPPVTNPPTTITPPPDTDLDDDDVPLFGLEPDDGIDIPDEITPLADAPQTGILQWPIPVLFSSGMLLVGCGMITGRSKKNDE